MTSIQADKDGPRYPADLTRPPSEFALSASRLVLERGVVLEKASDSLWRYRARGDSALAELSELQTNLQLRIIKVGFANPANGDTRFVAPVQSNKPVLEIQIQELAGAAGSIDHFADKVQHLAYILEATVYHCSRLAETYTEVLNRCVNQNPYSDDFYASGEVTPYFEFEALIATVVRAYETARFLLWAVFVKRPGVKSNFEDVVGEIRNPNLQEMLKNAVDDYKRAKEFRHCIAHNAHFGARLPKTRIQLWKGRVWSAHAILPDNPETKSYAKFTFDNRLDALTYGWSITDRVVGHIIGIVHAATAELVSDR